MANRIGAVTVAQANTSTSKCPELDTGGMLIPVGHLLEYEYDADACWEKHRCKKCGIFLESIAPGSSHKVLTFPPKPTLRDRSERDPMKRKHGCFATRKRDILWVSCGMGR